MPNQAQPTIAIGATGDVVRRAQRALRRTPDLGVVVDGIFGSTTETAVKTFQHASSLVADGIVGPLTWSALPDGGSMPVLKGGSVGAVVRSLQRVLTDGAPDQWYITPQGEDAILGPDTEASVRAFQSWAQVPVTGIVDEPTWDASLHAADQTLETTVGLEFVIG